MIGKLCNRTLKCGSVLMKSSKLRVSKRGIEIEVISSDSAPDYKVGLPKNQAVITPPNCSFIFTSAILGVNTKGELVSDNLTDQTNQLLENLSGILKSANSSVDDVIKANLYLCDLSKFDEVNNIYKKYFHKFPPTRDVCEVKKLPLDAKISMSVIATPHKSINIFRRYIGKWNKPIYTVVF